MNIDDLLTSLQPSDKELSNYIDSLPKKNKKSAKSFIEASVRLAYILFAITDHQRARMIVDPISKIQFSNSYDYWTWIEAALVLRGHIAKEDGDEASYGQALNAANQALQSGTELQINVKANVHRRFLEGQTLDTDFVEETDERNAFEMRINYFMTLFKIRFFGGSETWPMAKLDAEINDVTIELNKSIAKTGLDNLPPFK